MKLPIITHPEQQNDRLKELGVSLAAFFDTVRKRKDETCTVRIRIIYNRFPKYYSTKINLSEKDYIQLVTGKPRNELKEKKLIIFRMLKKANDIITEMESFQFEKFEKKFLNKTGAGNDVYFAFKEQIKQLQDNGKPGTASTYQTAMNSFKSFHKRSTLKFDDVTVSWLKNYENKMNLEDKSPTTISMNTRCLRKLYNIAISNNDVKKDKYPFGNNDKGFYQPPYHRNIKKALSKEALRKIFEYKPETNSTEHFNRDIWLFSYLCNGMNMADIFRLKYSHLIGDTIVFARHKTNHKRKSKSVMVILTDHSRAIIDKWGSKPVSSDNYIFSILSDGLTPTEERAKIKQGTKQCNKYMKRIAAKIGIDENISTYYARHSFASILKLSGEEISFISESLGHSSIAVTENYLSSFDIEKRKNAAKKLTDWD